MVDQKQILVGFIAVCPTQDDNGYLAGLLVTNDLGVPQEFRCTHPIRPTQAQKALYGDTLKPHLFNELLVIPLIKALTTNPSFFCIEDPILLQAADFIDLPVVHLQRLGEVLSVENHQSDATRIDSENVGFQPISATFGNGHDSDLGKIQDELNKVFNKIDLVEPFDRIATAIKALVERDKRFK